AEPGKSCEGLAQRLHGGVRWRAAAAVRYRGSSEEAPGIRREEQRGFREEAQGRAGEGQVRQLIGLWLSLDRMTKRGESPAFSLVNVSPEPSGHSARSTSSRRIRAIGDDGPARPFHLQAGSAPKHRRYIPSRNSRPANGRTAGPCGAAPPAEW